MSTAPALKPPTPSNASGPRPSHTQGGGPAATSTGIAVIDPVRLLKKYKWILAASVVVGAVFGVAMHFVLLRTFPQWTASAIFNIEPPRDEFGRLPESREVNEDELKRFMLTQVANMTGDQVLLRVCERINQNPALVPQWRKQFEKNGVFQPNVAMAELEKIVSGRMVAGTQLVQLSVSYRDPTEATQLTELMRREYLGFLQVQEQRANSELKAQLDGVLSNANARIATLQSDRDRLISGTGEGGTAAQAMESIDGRYTEAAQTMQIVSAQLQQARQELEMLEVRRAQMLAAKEAPGGINYPDMIRAMVDQSPLVAGARQTIDAVKTEIRVMQERGVGEAHRDWQNMQNRLRAAEQNLADIRERELLSMFNAQLDQAQTTILSINQAREKLEAQRAELSLRLQDLLSSQRKIQDMETNINRMIEDRSEVQTKLETIDAFIRQSTRNPDQGMGRVRVLAQERKPDEITFPKLRLVGPAGVVLVVGAVGGVLFLREILDQRVKSPQDIGMIPRTRVVGIIPHASEDPTNPKKMETAFRDKPKGVVAEYIRQVRAPLAKRLAQTDARSVLFVPGMPGSGATSIVSNMGFSMAAMEKKTLIIDANFRRPAQHKVFDLAEGPGLADVLAGKVSLDDAARATDQPNLSVLTVGSVDERVYERLAGNAMARLLADAKTKYDVILLDTAPAMVAGDAVALAAHCDASILVVRAMGEKRGLVARLRNELSDTRGEFLGVLVNAVRSAAGGYIRKNIAATHGYQTAA